MEAENKSILKEAYSRLCAYFRQPVEDYIIAMYVEDLSHIPVQDVLRAMRSLRIQPGRKFIPMPSDIIAYLNPGPEDGRLGVEEAWGICPVDEGQSTVWTPEIREAFGAALPALDRGDMIGARMAFKERYAQTLGEARAKGLPVEWIPSLGHDKVGRERVLSEAVRKGRIEALTAQKLLPDISFIATRTQPRLEGPAVDSVKQLTEGTK